MRERDMARGGDRRNEAPRRGLARQGASSKGSQAANAYTAHGSSCGSLEECSFTRRVVAEGGREKTGPHAKPAIRLGDSVLS
jgi:hypothetical protein